MGVGLGVAMATKVVVLMGRVREDEGGRRAVDEGRDGSTDEVVACGAGSELEEACVSVVIATDEEVDMDPMAEGEDDGGRSGGGREEEEGEGEKREEEGEGRRDGEGDGDGTSNSTPAKRSSRTAMICCS